MLNLDNLSPPADGIKHTEPDTVAHVNERNFGKGTLYIAESCLAWVNREGRGFSILYPSMTLHAVSKDLNAFPEECFYIMLSSEDDEGENSEGEGSDSDSDDENEAQSRITEIRFVPDNKANLHPMFIATKECQALHPDPSEFDQPGDDFIGGNYDDAEEEGEDDDSGVYYVEDNNVVNASHQANLIGGGDSTVNNGQEDLGYQNGVEGGEDEEPMDVGQFEDAEQ